MFPSRSLARAAAILALGLPVTAQAPGEVASWVKISELRGFGIPLDDNDQLGRSAAAIGDLDGDGVEDLALAGHADDDGGVDRGAVYVCFLRPTGRVREVTKISSLAGGFTGPLHNRDQFGRALAGIGDLDGDGVPDLAVGANFDNDGGFDRGAVWILFLNPDGTVKAEAKISSLSGGLTGLDDRDEFGRALAAPGDLDGDGVLDLCVAAPYDDDGGANKGAVYVLFLNPDGSVKGQQKISVGNGGFTGHLFSNDLFGFSLAALGDIDGSGNLALAVGAALDDDTAFNAGAVWIVFLGSDGIVQHHTKISGVTGGFTGLLESPDQFGVSAARLGDLDGDGRPELAVGAVKDGDGGTERGAVWILFLRFDGTVRRHGKISATEGSFTGPLVDYDWFGSSLAGLDDVDGFGELVVGARFDDEGGLNHGAAYVCFLHGSSGAPGPGEPAPHDAPGAVAGVVGFGQAPPVTPPGLSVPAALRQVVLEAPVLDAEVLLGWQAERGGAVLGLRRWPGRRGPEGLVLQLPPVPARAGPSGNWWVLPLHDGHGVDASMRLPRTR
jgi:hypothetical protein